MRTFFFAAGAGAVVIALLPPIASAAHVDLRAHMLQHLLLGMFAPLGIVLARPGAVVLRRLPRRAARAVVRSRLVHVLTHPFVALVLNVGGMYALYMTPLYGVMNHRYHVLLHVHFFAAGCLFVWAIAGADAVSRRVSPKTRLAVLFIAIAAHTLLAKMMYAYEWPRGTHHTIDEIRSAAKLMYYAGDLAELLLIVAFFSFLPRLHFVQKRHAS